MIECANSESTGEMWQFSVRRHLSSASGKGGQWVVHPVDSNAFLYRVQATIKYNVLLSCLRLLFIMGRKGGFSCPGGEQKLLMELFYTDKNGNKHLVWFEDARSIIAKYRLISQYGIRGMGGWKLGLPFPQAEAMLRQMFWVEKP